jgi:NAD+ synthase
MLARSSPDPLAMALPPNELIAHITSWMRRYCEEQQMKGFVVGVSGGVDSAVPIHQHADELERATAHMAWLKKRYANVRTKEMQLDPLFDAMEREFRTHAGKGENDLAMVNTKSRLRLSAMYYCATVNGYLVVGTGNKVEQYGVGFFAKYGDGGMDLAPLGALLKTEVLALAYAMEIDQRIIDAPPTDGLWPDGRTDEEQIGASYPELEWAMDLREREVDTEAMKLTRRQRKVLRIYDQRHGDNQHKTFAPPVCPIPQGVDWPANKER